MNGQVHNLNGPAIKFFSGSKFWFQNNKLHRIDGPAIEYIDGDMFWYFNNQLHNLNGPAVEYADGDKEWFLEGKEYTEEEFLKKTSQVKDLTVEVISKLPYLEAKVAKG